MPRYRFHCTNGSECVLDGVGTLVRSPALLARRARERAREVARSLGEDGAALERWQVTVHDLTGRRVLVQPFGGAS
jgi:hypothetical protein